MLYSRIVSSYPNALLQVHDEASLKPTRRRFLLATPAAFLILSSRAHAMLPVILAAIAAVTALALATAKAAGALDQAVSKGERLWRRLASVEERSRARREVSEEQGRLQDQLKIRRDVIRSGAQAQSANARVVSRIEYFIIKQDSDNWNDIVAVVRQAAIALRQTASIFRENAVWFPSEAQDDLAQLPRLYEARVSILTDLDRLSESPPPSTPENLDQLKRLVEAYDQLRVQSLKLLKALDLYTS
jgi:hypothetical protein